MEGREILIQKGLFAKMSSSSDIVRKEFVEMVERLKVEVHLHNFKIKKAIGLHGDFYVYRYKKYRIIFQLKENQIIIIDFFKRAELGNLAKVISQYE